MKHRFYFWFIALAILFLDQAVKYLVQSILFPLKSVTIIKGFLSISYVRNFGAAFGMFPGQRIMLLIVSIVVCAVVLYFHSKMRHDDGLLHSSMALIFGGSMGNLIDRIFRPYVIDYIDFRFWPAFNIADMAVNIGIFIIICEMIIRRECS